MVHKRPEGPSVLAFALKVGKGGVCIPRRVAARPVPWLFGGIAASTIFRLLTSMAVVNGFQQDWRSHHCFAL